MLWQLWIRSKPGLGFEQTFQDSPGQGVIAQPNGDLLDLVAGRLVIGIEQGAGRGSHNQFAARNGPVLKGRADLIKNFSHPFRYRQRLVTGSDLTRHGNGSCNIAMERVWVRRDGSAQIKQSGSRNGNTTELPGEDPGMLANLIERQNDGPGHPFFFLSLGPDEELIDDLATSLG